MTEQTRWLTPTQQKAWRAYLLGVAHITEVLDSDLRRHGLDLNEYEILVALSEAPDWKLRMSEVAELVHQSRSRLTHTIGRMERAGLVQREPAEEDRRGVVASLTRSGFELLDAAAPSHVAAVRRVFVDVVDPDDFEALGRAFRAVLDANQ